MVMIAEYNKIYIQLRKRIKNLKRELSSRMLNEQTLELNRQLDTVATELDIRYSDGQNLEIVENNLNSFESCL